MSPVEGQSPRIAFRRLTEVAPEAIGRLLNETRNWRHMPLAGAFSEEAVADWIRDKDAQWAHHGYGPWAILVGDEFAGWGGFQLEGDATDYGLVLAPRFWGVGAAVTRLALDLGFGELALADVTIALPFTRNVGAALGRVGFLPDGVVTHGEATFRRFRLSRTEWLRLRG